jgi:hypothetical protein
MIRMTGLRNQTYWQWRRLSKIFGCAKIKSQLELVCFLKKNVLKSTKCGRNSLFWVCIAHFAHAVTTPPHTGNNYCGPFTRHRHLDKEPVLTQDQ